jgi:LPXTG-site transpeptidase (sortase) family protein
MTKKRVVIFGVRGYSRLVLLVVLFCSLVFSPQGAQAQVLSFSAEINKEFSPISIASGGISRLSITIFNPNLFPLSNAAWTDNLIGVQPGISIANPVNLVSSCGPILNVNAPAGGISLSLSGGNVPAQVGSTPGSCTVSIDVTSTTPGNLINTIPAAGLTGTGGGGTITNTTPASATLRVDAVLPPQIDKSFNPNTMWVGEVSQLTISINNTDPSTTLTQASLTDNLPANVILANPVGASLTNCGPSASLTAVSGAGSVVLSNSAIAPNATCLIRVNVTSTVSGAYVNTIPAHSLQTLQGVTNDSPVSAPLNVQGIGLAKVFSPEGFEAGGTTTLTITLRNPTSSPLTGVNVSDVLPGTTLTVVPNSASTTCGGTASATLPRTFGLTGGTVPAGSVASPGTCTITVQVTAPANSFASTFENIIPVGVITTSQEITNVLPATAPVFIYAFGTGVLANKSFTPSTIEPGGNSLLTIYITPPVDTDLTNFSIVDHLPTNIVVSNSLPATKSAECGASSALTAVTGATSVSLAGGTVLSGATCQISVYVTSNVAGDYTNTINPDDITNNEGRSTSSPVTADLTVRPLSNFFVEKIFSPDTVSPNGISTLTITLRNENTSPLIGASLLDTLPGDTINGVVIAPVPNATTNCGSGAIAVIAGGKTVSMSGGTIPAQVAGVPGICTIRVDVQGVGVSSVRNNIIPTTDVNATIQGTATTVNPMEDAIAPFTITDLSIGVVKGFNPLTVFGGSASTMSVQLVNPNNADLVGIKFTDTMPLGMIIANPVSPTVGTCGGSISATPGDGFFTFSGGSLPPFGSCTLTISITMIVNGNRTNTIAANAVTTSNGARNPQPAEASLTNLPGASISKSFSPNPINVGEYSLLTITIQNTGNIPLTGMGLSDGLPGNLPTGLKVAGAPAPSPVNNCGGSLTAASGAQQIRLTGGSVDASSSCTIVVAVTSDTPGSYQNIIPARNLTSSEGATNNTPATDTLVVLSATQASLGDYVWNDTNLNGIQDVGETGIPNVTVELFNSAGGSQGTTVTNASGLYSFTGLTPGDYYVQFTPPSGYVISPQDQGSNDAVDSDVNAITGRTITTTLVAGENDLTWDAGLYQLASIGDFVWNDTNANGIQDAGEAGIPDVTVELFNDTGVSQGTTTTDSNGIYNFTGLTPGDYYVKFTPPSGYLISPQDQGGNDAVDSDMNAITGQTITTTLVAGENDLTWDAGLYQLASIGDFVWNDTNANGIQDAGETGIPNVAVELFNSAGVSQGTTVTNASGLYSFTGLTPGDYYVQFTPPSGYVISPQDQGSNDAADSDANTTNGQTITTTLVAGENDLTWDAGLHQPALASLGDFVWNDLNADGIQDSGEAGINGVTVRLHASNGAVVATTTTSNGGQYLFSNLTPGDYYVEFVPPTGYVISPQNQGGDDTVDSDADTTTGITATTTLVAGENDLTWDAGLHQQQSPGGLTKIISTTNLPSTTGTNVAVGEIVTYQVAVVIPPGSYANATLVDTMDRGLAFVGCDSIDASGLTTDVSGSFTQVCANPTTDSASLPMDVDRVVRFNFGTLANNSQSDVTLQITYRAIVLDIATNVNATSLRNSASFQWVSGNLGPAQTSVTIVEPDLQIRKTSNVNFIANGSEVTFTLTISHTSASSSDAFDVVIRDVLPTGLDYVANSLDCTSGAQDPDVECVFDNSNPSEPTIRAQWSVFTRSGGNAQIKFRAVGNTSIPSNGNVTNTANVEWTSMPGAQTTPTSFSKPANIFATERYYDPNNLIDLYADSDALTLTPLGDNNNNNDNNPPSRPPVVASGFLIPVTGFAPNTVTKLDQAARQVYSPTSLTVEIPVINVKTGIVGVELKDGNWDVSWLQDQAGWLDGTAYPTWTGNSVLTAHSVNKDGKAGIFSKLKSLKNGEYIFVYNNGYRYTYKVVSNTTVKPNDISVLAHEEKAYITLITCDNYNEKTGVYLNRVAVRALLVDVSRDK